MKKDFIFRFAHLVLVLGELLFGKPPVRCKIPNVRMKLRFGGAEIFFNLEDSLVANFHVTNDHQDEPFSVSPITGAKDAEGEVIGPEEFTQTPVVTDNETAVSIIDDPNNPGGKALHFGTSGTAHVSTDTLYRGEVVRHTESTITVTTGAIDPNSIQGGDFLIPGLTPDTAPAPVV